MGFYAYIRLKAGGVAPSINPRYKPGRGSSTQLSSEESEEETSFYWSSKMMEDSCNTNTSVSVERKTWGYRTIWDMGGQMPKMFTCVFTCLYDLHKSSKPPTLALCSLNACIESCSCKVKHACYLRKVSKARRKTSYLNASDKKLSTVAKEAFKCSWFMFYTLCFSL